MHVQEADERQRPDAPLLLVVDYPGRRSAGHLADLGLEQAGFAVEYLMTAPLPTALSAREYARALLAGRRSAMPRVAGVLAFCMAGHIAQEVAALLREAGEPPVPLVLFDSGPSVAEDLEDECRQALSLQGGPRLAGSVGRDTLSEQALRERPEASLAAVREALVEFAVSAYCEDGGDRAEALETVLPLVDGFTDWLAHLTAAFNATSPGWGGDVLHIVSREHTVTEPWPGAGRTTTVRIDCARDRLLRSEAALRAVTSSIPPGTAPRR
ncbi:hypothetical protein ACI2LO_16540 [Streptomyces sp. NPDC033754]|uniref:hypothetical protein n=1 Tax=unclassified Streptomyces TaxID=2593676 RepID=UPI0033C16B3C